MGDGANLLIALESRRSASGLIALIPFLIAVIALFASKSLRAINAAMPNAWLIGIQTYRVAGIMFVFPFLTYGILPARFAWPAGIGDAITGIFAPVVALMVARNRPHAFKWAVAWNLFGTLDLIVAPATALYFEARGPGIYPLNLVPLFLGPPIGILTHIFIRSGTWPSLNRSRSQASLCLTPPTAASKAKRIRRRNSVKKSYFFLRSLLNCRHARQKALLFLAGLIAASAHAQTGTHIPVPESRAYLNTIAQDSHTSAVDAEGIRHESHEYQGKLAPWLQDQIKMVAPDYPFEERYRHHVGRGVFRLMLDVNTGLVTQVDLLKSTGFRDLDDSASQALRYWRWKPRKWKEVVMPVEFTLPGVFSPKASSPGIVPISRH